MERPKYGEAALEGLDEETLKVLAEARWEAFLTWVHRHPDASRLLKALELVSLVAQDVEQGDALEACHLRAALDAVEWFGTRLWPDCVVFRWWSGYQPWVSSELQRTETNTQGEKWRVR